MNTFSIHILSRRARGGGPVVAVVALVAACGSTSAASSPGTGAPSTSASAAAVSSAPAHVSSATAEVTARNGPLGTYLTDGSGRTLYMFASDTATKSSCPAACLKFWPAFTTTGAPTAGSGTTARDLSTVVGANGAKQVSYAGHLLYYFAEDTAAGQTNGQGSDGFGARWWLLTPAGKPITTTGSAASAPTTAATAQSRTGY